jgi:hypothetical protein
VLLAEHSVLERKLMHLEVWLLIQTPK